MYIMIDKTKRFDFRDAISLELARETQEQLWATGVYESISLYHSNGELDNTLES